MLERLKFEVSSLSGCEEIAVVQAFRPAVSGGLMLESLKSQVSNLTSTSPAGRAKAES